MFDPTELLIDAFVAELKEAYRRTWSDAEPEIPGIIEWAGRMALENIAHSDALYHDIEHTILVTLVGQEILKGRHIQEGGVSPRDWMHFLISLLCHDIGYVRGACPGDTPGAWVTGEGDKTIALPPGATDAAMTPWHVDRGKRFVRARFHNHPFIDPEIIARNIELTRFPVPDDQDHRDTAGYPGLLRAADLIGQLSDPARDRKVPALFYEFQETGTNAALGYRTPDDLRRAYPGFFWGVVFPYIQDGLRHLKVTAAGRQWIANLYAQVFSASDERAI